MAFAHSSLILANYFFLLIARWYESILLMLNYKYSSIFGAVGVAIGLCCFLFNYYMVPVLLPGYKVVAAPAMFVLSFFSEETDFAPKMILFLSGQFLGYFLIGCIVQIIKKHGGYRLSHKPFKQDK